MRCVTDTVQPGPLEVDVFQYCPPQVEQSELE